MGVDTIPAFEGKCVSGGRLNINNAVDYLYTEQRPIYSVGDVNGDGYITFADCRLIQDYLSWTISLDEQQLSAADRDGNGNVISADMLSINLFVNRTDYYAPYYNS